MMRETDIFISKIFHSQSCPIINRRSRIRFSNKKRYSQNKQVIRPVQNKEEPLIKIIIFSFRHNFLDIIVQNFLKSTFKTNKQFNSNMQAFFSCFSCGQKSSTVAVPKTIQVSASKIEGQWESSEKQNLSLMQSFDDEKSKTATTITFRTTDTAPSKFQDDDQLIQNKVQQVRKKDLAQRKAIEQQFIKQNLSKSKVIYLVEKQWSEQYTKFLKDPKIKSIRPVDNKGLLDQKGRLRTDLRQREDYFLINQRIWKFVKLLYGGGPDIARDAFFPVFILQTKKYQLPPCGLINPLNLCYMISVMQSLLSIQQFNFHFYKKQYTQAAENKKKPLHNQLHKFIKLLIQDPQQKKQIKQFASFFQSKFNPYQQHDAQEFFLHLVNQLQQQMKSQLPTPKSFKDPESAYYFYMTANRSIVDKAFAGQVSSTVGCKACGEDSVTYLPFVDLCVGISEATLQGCLKKHFELEKLEDLYDCERCKKKSKATKKLSLTKTPNYLMIVLKKFTLSGKKIQDRIKYPLQLDVKKVTDGHCGQTRFSLLSVIIHKGAKSTKGHYYCYTRRTKKEWMYCNDEHLQPVEEGEVLGKDAYMFLYERVK